MVRVSTALEPAPFGDTPTPGPPYTTKPCEITTFFPALLALCFTRLFGALVCFVIRLNAMSLPSLSFPARASIKPALQHAES
jgi:hypothetical protein